MTLQGSSYGPSGGIGVGAGNVMGLGGNLPGTFELMGLDFMLDDESHVQVIEVNTSPALFRKGAHLKELLPQVMEEVLQKALDPWFPPPQHASYPDKLNVFEEIPIGL